MRSLYFIMAVCMFGGSLPASAQNSLNGESGFSDDVHKHLYVGSGLDFAMLSTAFVSKPGSNTALTVPRFTTVVNIGFAFHYDLNNKIGLISGIGLRNMGFIEKEDDMTIKRRVYSLGIPLGIKLGNLAGRNFVFGGLGVDLPFNYREKTFRSRSNKTKYSEWIGDQTPRVLPFLFMGHSWSPGITVKLQYYPANFLNADYETSNIVQQRIKPFAGYNVNIFLLSAGIDIHYGKYRIQERHYRKLREIQNQY